MGAPRSRLLACLSAALLALAGCGDSEETSSTADQGAEETTASAPEQEPGEGTEIYFTAGEQFQPVDRELPGGRIRAHRGGGGGDRRAAGREAGGRSDPPPRSPRAPSSRTQHSPGGTATVEVSGEFTAGIPDEPAARSRAEDARSSTPGSARSPTR